MDSPPPRPSRKDRFWPTTAPSIVAMLGELNEGSDEEVWRKLVDRYSPGIVRFLHARGLQPDDVMDLTQEILVKLLRAFADRKFDHRRGSFRGWLSRVAYYCFIDFVRKRARSPAQTNLELLLQESAAEELADEVERRRQAEILRHAISTLPDRCRRYVELQLQGFDTAAIASELQITKAAVYQLRHRTNQYLRRIIDLGEEP